MPFAESCITKLKKLGLPYAGQSFEVDGVKIEVRIRPGHEYLKVEGCPPFMSGVMLRGWNMLGPPPEDAEKLGFFYPSAAQADDQPRAWELLKKYPPMDERTHGIDFRKFKIPYLTHKREPFPDLLPPEPWVNYTDYPQVAVIRPGMYSGTMRSVIQYMLGTKAPVKFDYTFRCTHGIMNVPSRGGTVPWVIEISSLFGVLASKLNTCTRTKSTGTLGYTPLGSALPCTADKLDALIESGRVKRLLTVEQMSEFYGLAAMFHECGWAFSYSGTEAQNTCRGKTGIYHTGHRFKLTFAHADGEPTSATLTPMDDGYMISNPGLLYARSQVRLPDYALQGCITMDMRPDVQGAHSVDSICPIYVYYDTNDEEQLVTWVNEKLVANEAPQFPDWTTFDPNVEGNYGVPYYQSGRPHGSKSRFYQITSPIYPSADLYTMGANVTTYTPVIVGGFKQHCWSVGGSSGLKSKQVITPFIVKVGVPEGQGIGSRHTLTIPLYEREMIYHLREEIDYSTAAGLGVVEYTRFHSEMPTGVFFLNQLIDGGGNPYGDHIWDFMRMDGGSSYSTSFSAGLFTTAWPIGLLSSSHQSPGQFDLMVTTPYPELNQISSLTERSSQWSMGVAGSGFPVQSLPVGPPPAEDEDSIWYKRLPDAMGWASQLWVARSADGLHIVPKVERATGITEDDFIYNLKEYPTDLTLSAPWVVFVGNAADKDAT